MCGVISGGGAAWYLRGTGDHDTHYGTWSGVTRTVHALCGIEFPPGCGRLWWHVCSRPAARPGSGVPDLSQQGQRTGLKGSVAHPRGPSWRVLSRAYAPQRAKWGAVDVAVLDRWTRKPERIDPRCGGRWGSRC
jgi:hypothetical protein